MSETQIAPQQAVPQQATPPEFEAIRARKISKVRRWHIPLIVLSTLVLLADIGLCAYFAYWSVNTSSTNYYPYGSYFYDANYYTMRAGICGGVAFIALCSLTYYIARYRRIIRKLKDPNQYMTPGVTYVYQSNAVPVYYPPSGAQWQQPPQGYAAMPYPQAAYSPPPPGQQPNPNYTYQQPQFQQPMQQLQQPPANPSQL